MKEHHAMLFTSIRDTSGNVILEAMAAGLPVITLNHQGAAEITTDETALRVTPGTVAETGERLAEAICTLAADAALRERLGRAGAERVRTHFHWPQKAAEMSRVYREVAGMD
jgi:glycosyltransferase involved in cell wall biosynthesis